MDNNKEQPQFQIQKVYVKDASFTIPNADKVWSKQWQPQLQTDLNVTSVKLPEENTYESVLTVDVKVENDGELAFEVEIKQAGIFTVSNMDDDQIEHAKNSFCPNMLYHYAREAISDLVTSGGFPQLCLSAVNFDAMYQDSLKQAVDDKQH